MKKCSRYLDALDKNAAANSAGWQDILVHACKCPDCSTEMRFRSEMLEKLSEVNEPPYPADLHETIMSSIAASSGSNREAEDYGLFNRLLEQFLQPLGITVSLACVLMFVVLIQLNYEADSTKTVVRVAQLPASSQTRKVLSGPVPDETTLEHVSSAEVKDFLVKLEEFRRAHPDELTPGATFMPGVELVDDKQLWREP